MEWLDDPGTRLLARAVLVCVLLGISGGLLGCVLVARRLTLMADALSHSLLPGVGIAWLVVGTGTATLLIGGLTAGLVTALCAGLLSRLTRLHEDAAFAALFSALLATGILLLSYHGGVGNLQHLLFGQLLAVTTAELILAAVACAATIIAFTVGYRAIVLECFDPDFHRSCGGRGTAVHLGLLALVVVVLVTALHAMGALLALGLFTLPAVSASLWCERWHRQLILAAAMAAVGAVAGVVTSLMSGMPSGACVVAALGVLFAISSVVAPQGLLAHRQRRRRHQQEDDEAACELPDSGHHH
jgi:zinc/manganese transport system permease protein